MKDLMTINRMTDKTYVIQLRGNVVGILTAYEEITTEYLKALRASLDEDIECREMRDRDEKDLRSGMYDDKIEAWKQKHPDQKQ